MGCCAGSGYTREEVNGICPNCGTETIDGDAYEQCGYSEVACETCGWAPCNGAC